MKFNNTFLANLVKSSAENARYDVDAITTFGSAVAVDSAIAFINATNNSAVMLDNAEKTISDLAVGYKAVAEYFAENIYVWFCWVMNIFPPANVKSTTRQSICDAGEKMSHYTSMSYRNNNAEAPSYLNFPSWMHLIDEKGFRALFTWNILERVEAFTL